MCLHSSPGGMQTKVRYANPDQMIKVDIIAVIAGCLRCAWYWQNVTSVRFSTNTRMIGSEVVVEWGNPHILAMAWNWQLL